MQKSIINRISSLILSVWLLSAIFLTIQFTAYFMDFMVTAHPMVRIDSFEDLVKHKDTKIVIKDDDSLTQYLRENDTQLKRSLLPMLDTYEHEFISVMKKLAIGLRDRLI